MLSKHIDIEDSKPLNKNIKELTLSCQFDHEETASLEAQTRFNEDHRAAAGGVAITLSPT